LNHIKSREQPEALTPGSVYQTSVKLDALGQSIPAGHRLELAVSPTYWPQAWTSPKPVTLTILAGENTKLSLPVRSGRSELDQTIQFLRPETAKVIDKEIRREESLKRDIPNTKLPDELTVQEFYDKHVTDTT